MAHATSFHARAIDDDPRLLEQSYRLRFQVYCVERQFLDAAAYPDQRETDEFDEHSLHIAVIDSAGTMAGTARLIKPNPHGFPMFRHCAFFPEVQTLDGPHVVPVEVSRLAISRHAAPRQRHTEPLLTLVKAMVQGARLLGATHLMGANEAALHRRLAHFGFPYRMCGPISDYYGPVAPYLMSLRELDDVIDNRRFPALLGLESAPSLTASVSC